MYKDIRYASSWIQICSGFNGVLMEMQTIEQASCQNFRFPYNIWKSEINNILKQQDGSRWTKRGDRLNIQNRMVMTILTVWHEQIYNSARYAASYVSIFFP